MSLPPHTQFSIHKLQCTGKIRDKVVWEHHSSSTTRKTKVDMISDSESKLECCQQKISTIFIEVKVIPFLYLNLPSN
jgi:hypothetical protein